MISYAKGVIKITEEAEPFFNEKEEEIKYFKNWFKDETGEVHELTSANNYEEFEGKDVIVKLKIVKQYGAKGYKVNINAVQENDEDQEVIAF